MKDLDEDAPAAPTPITPSRPAIPPNKSGKKAMLAWIVATVMALAAGGFAWLYYTNDAEPTAEQTATTDQADDGQTAEDSTAETKTVYEAEVGKFALDLASTYAVVENLDANFEGGPATSVQIGQVAADTPGVVTTNPGQAFTIFARPEAGATLASNSRVDALEDNELATQQADTTFADTPARVYQEDGLFVVRHIVFVKNDIVYTISLLSEDATQTAMLKAVDTGFSFVE